MSKTPQPTILKEGSDHSADRLIEVAQWLALPKPLLETFDELPKKVASIFSADICSIYLLDGEHLVLRANEGFPKHALSDITLSIGEGITGLAVEHQRPISLSIANKHDAYRHFPELGEEHFPLFLAVPIAGPKSPLGALVLQRKAGSIFSDTDIDLAIALTIPISTIIMRAKVVEAPTQGLRIASGTRRVTLSGRRVTPGKAVGKIYLVPRPPQNDNSDRPLKEALITVVHELKDYLEKLERRADYLEVDPKPIKTLNTMLADTRIHKRTIEIAKKETCSLGRAFSKVGAEVAGAALKTSDTFNTKRTKDLVDLCEALALLHNKAGIDDPKGSIFASNRINLYDLWLADHLRPQAYVLRERADGELQHSLQELFNLPLICGVRGIFRWAAKDDLLFVDADSGMVRVNPSRAEIAIIRKQRRLTQEQSKY